MPAFPDNWSWFAAVLALQAAALAGFWWWSRRFTAPGVRAFHLTVLGMSGRTAAEAIESLFAASAPETLYWTLGGKCIASGLFGAGLLLLFADVSGLNRWATPLRRRLLVAGLLALGTLAFTNPWTGWISPDTATAAGWSFGRYRLGPVFLLLAWANAAALLFGLGATLYVWRGASPLLRKQLGLLLAGCSLPVLTVFAYRAGIYPTDWPNLTPLTRIGAIALFAWALNREQLWRLVPIARSFVLEQHDHAMIVADRNGNVVDSNPAARRLLALPESALLRRPVGQALDSWPTLAALVRIRDYAIAEVHPTPSADTCWFASWHPLRNDPNGAPRGYLLDIADITERKRTERALQAALDARTHEWQRATAAALRAAEEEQHRLGNLLHDTLCQDLIACTRQTSLLRDDIARGTPPDSARLASLESTLAEAGKRAREISHLLAGTIHAALPFGEKLAAVLRQLETALSLECELAIDPAFPEPDTEQGVLLVRIVREALVNAARHGHARRAWIDLMTTAEHAILTISNDGTPPPAAPTEGLGLRQLRMRAALLGGSFQLSTSPAGGGCLELQLPLVLPPLPAA